MYKTLNLLILSFLIFIFRLSAIATPQQNHPAWPSAGYIIDVSKSALRAQSTSSMCYNHNYFVNGLHCGGKGEDALDALNRCDCKFAHDFPIIPEKDQKQFSWKSIWTFVPPVDQGLTKACWAISSASVLDAARCIANFKDNCQLAADQTTVTSVKHLCGCAQKMFGESELMRQQCPRVQIGCEDNGGYANIGMTTLSFAYEKSAYPINEATYSTSYSPWQEGTCQSPERGGILSKVHCANIETNTARLPLNATAEDVLMQAVYKAPVAVTIVFDESLWGDYKGGIFDNEACDMQIFGLGHVVVVTGWGEENGVKYWELRNSMGSSWGEGGYFRIKRGVKTKSGYGLCGIAYVPTMGWF